MKVWNSILINAFFLLLQNSFAEAWSETSEKTETISRTRASRSVQRQHTEINKQSNASSKQGSKLGWSELGKTDLAACPEKLSYTKRLNQLVLDDNLRALRHAAGSESIRHSQSFRDLESLVARLSNRDLEASNRWQAAQAIARCPHVLATLAVPSLIQSFTSDSDITLRNYCALALVRIDLRSAIPVLVQFLDNQDSDIRSVSESAIYSAGERAMPLLVKLLRCCDPHMKKLGCLALAALGQPASKGLVVLHALATANDTDANVAQVAFSTALSIEKTRQLMRSSGTEIPFDTELWLDDEYELYRPAMVRYILSHRLLIDKTSDQVVQLLGHGISFDHGQEIRYSVGSIKLNSHSDLSEDSYLVLSLQKGVVVNCQLKKFSPSDWNADHQDDLTRDSIQLVSQS